MEDAYWRMLGLKSPFPLARIFTIPNRFQQTDIIEEVPIREFGD